MNAIRIHTQLDSTTLALPEIAPLVGKRVEIIVREESPTTSTEVDWDALDRAVEGLRQTYDFDAITQQNETDRKTSERNARLWE
jgi:hypothetical protein